MRNSIGFLLFWVGAIFGSGILYLSSLEIGVLEISRLEWGVLVASCGLILVVLFFKRPEAKEDHRPDILPATRKVWSHDYPETPEGRMNKILAKLPEDYDEEDVRKSVAGEFYLDINHKVDARLFKILRMGFLSYKREFPNGLFDEMQKLDWGKSCSSESGYPFERLGIDLGDLHKRYMSDEKFFVEFPGGDTIQGLLEYYSEAFTDSGLSSISFSWVKAIDTRVWYALNAFGREEFFLPALANMILFHGGKDMSVGDAVDQSTEVFMAYMRRNHGDDVRAWNNRTTPRILM